MKRFLSALFAGLFFVGTANAQSISGPAISIGPNGAAGYGDSRLTYLTPQQYGAKGDGQKINVPVTRVAGTNALTVTYALFSAADVGKLIAIPGDGTQATTGSVTAAALATPGAGYTSPPTCAFSGGGGTGATCAANLQVLSSPLPTVTYGGSGCPSGTNIAFQMLNGTYATAAVLNATVTSGVVTSITSVPTPGSYSSLYNTSGITLYNASCTFQPQVTPSFGVAAIGVTGLGAGYSGTVTATLNGGGFTTAATSGAVTVTIPPAILLTTIASFTDSRHVTTAANAVSTLSAVAQTISWCSNDQTALSNWIAAIPTGASSQTGAKGYVPPGIYCHTGTLTMPDTAPSKIEGAGRETSTFLAMATMTDQFYKGVGGFTQSQGGTVRDVTFDGNMLASTGIHHLGHQWGFDTVNIRNDTVQNVLFDTGAAENFLINSKFETDQVMVTTPAWYPLYNFFNKGNDNRSINNIAINAQTANFRDIAFANNYYVANHTYGYPGPLGFAQYGYWFTGGVFGANNEADGAQLAGFQIDGAHVELGTSRFIEAYQPIAGVPVGVNIPLDPTTSASVANVSLSGLDAPGTDAAHMVVQAGQGSSTTVVTGCSGCKFVTGKSQNVGLFSNANGQAAIAGGDYSRSQGQFGYASGKFGDVFGIGTDKGRFGSQCIEFQNFSVQGDNASCVLLLTKRTTGTTQQKLTADQGTANSTNCVNVPSGTDATLHMMLVGRDNTTTGQVYSWNVPHAALHRDVAASTTSLTLATATVISAITTGTVTITPTADTTNACVSFAVTPPNTDQWDWGLRIETVEVN